MNVPASRKATLTRAASGLMAILTMLVGAGCSKDATYTYVNVHVMVDPQTVTPSQLATVVGCEFQVLGAEMTDGFTLRCRENNVQYDVGTLNWTSNAPSGSLQFRVRIYAVNRVVVGEGTSDAVPASPGKRFNTEVLVKGIPPTTEPDGGVDADVIDSGTDGDISVDAGADTATDVAVDQATAGDGGAPDEPPDQAPSDGTTSDTATDDGVDATAG